MAQGPLFDDSYRPQLSGHETFPLRYGWLKKAYDAVRECDDDEAAAKVFQGDDAIARFGVGKNMVASMRHWATAVGVIGEDGPGSLCSTSFGRKVFEVGGLDPYMENPATLWLVHWRLSAYPAKTTWYFALNYFNSITFQREHLVTSIAKLASERRWSRVASKTIKNDVACFVRTYVPQGATRPTSHDDTLESPLTELGLIRPIGRRDGFRFSRGPKPTLGDGVFTYALLDFWRARRGTATLSLEAISHAPGSPGRVFLLDESDVAERLSRLDDVTQGALRWSETAGLKQVVRERDLDFNVALGVIDRDYGVRIRREAA